jgi:hypothetical protein
VQYTVIIISIFPSTQLLFPNRFYFQPLHVSVSFDHLQVAHKNFKLNSVALHVCDV